MVMLLVAAGMALTAAALWSALGDTGFRRAAAICLMGVAVALAVSGGTAIPRLTTLDARAFLGRGPEQPESEHAGGLTGLGILLFVSLPLLAAGLFVFG
jgi:hypothetical protein